MTTLAILQAAKAAAPSLAALDTDKKNAALLSMAEALVEHTETILQANAQDMTGILYDMNPDTFDGWAESVIAAMMSL